MRRNNELNGSAPYRPTDRHTRTQPVECRECRRIWSTVGFYTSFFAGAKFSSYCPGIRLHSTPYTSAKCAKRVSKLCRTSEAPWPKRRCGGVAENRFYQTDHCLSLARNGAHSHTCAYAYTHREPESIMSARHRHMICIAAVIPIGYATVISMCLCASVSV